MTWLAAVVMSLFVVSPATATTGPLLQGQVVANGHGIGSADVRLGAPLEMPGITAELDTTSDFVGLFLIEKAASSSTPWTAAWLQPSADVVCEGVVACNRERLANETPISYTPENSTALPPGDYRLIVVTDPPGAFTIKLKTPGTGVTGVPMAPTDGVQVARLYDQDLSQTNHLWWTGAERSVEPNAVMATVAALAGPVKGPGEFNYCAFNGEPALTGLGFGELTYSTCAGGVVVGTRAVTATTDYTSVLEGLAFPGTQGTAGQGAHFNGVIDIQSYMAVSVWIDP